MRRILLIDDDRHVRASMSLVLSARGFDVVAADSGAAGLRAFGNGPFDIAIVDLFMPGMDGVKLIKTMRERVPNFPVVAVSGVLMRTSGRTALDFFPMAPDLVDIVCLQKPFRPPDLLNAITRALEPGSPAQAIA
jgi:CheY-like chemotaxis protein